MLEVQNSLTKRQDPFVPMEPGKIGFYLCGPTVYDEAHLGHARTYVVFDTWIRVLRYFFGYDVNFVMNITDIDDKIINKSNELKTDYLKVSRFYEARFFADIAALNCEMPNHVLRVSEHIPEIILMIEKIIANGFAYCNEGSVYFDVYAYHNSGSHEFGVLQPERAALINDETKNSGDVRNTDKRSELDFALWKAAKPNEPFFASPWGIGRPGWHIECSAMAASVLPVPFDIHAGGVDLMFPHHENEIAQTRACFNMPAMANYFLHSGHLHIDGCKMSKSLKNFDPISALLEKYNYQIIRLFFLLHKWETVLSYSRNDNVFDEAKEYHSYFSTFIGTVKSILLQNKQKQSAIDSCVDFELCPLSDECISKKKDLKKTLNEHFDNFKSEVASRFENNLDSKSVLLALKKLISTLNKNLSVQTQEYLDYYQIETFVKYIAHIFYCLGLQKDNSLFGYLDSEQASGAVNTELISLSVDFRSVVRNACKPSGKLLKKIGKATAGNADVAPLLEEVSSSFVKLFDSSDNFRTMLASKMNIQIDDNGVDSTWKFI